MKVLPSLRTNVDISLDANNKNRLVVCGDKLGDNVRGYWDLQQKKKKSVFFKICKPSFL